MLQAMLGLFRVWRRRRLRRRPFPPEWLPVLASRLPFYRLMTPEAQVTLRDNVKIFAWEKYFIGAAGLVVTDEMRVVISAAACRIIQHLDLSYYDRLTEIVVYPHDYRHPVTGEARLGEAHHWGVVVLSWPAVLRGLGNPCDGWDTAVHEFAHVLDRDGGSFDGTPRLRADDHYRAWAEVMSRHFERLRQGSPREGVVLRDYGGKNAAEFFAVATEAFFERPRVMRQLTPALFEELRQFYGFDPSAQSPCGAPPGSGPG
jgi:hypothetical protein